MIGECIPNPMEFLAETEPSVLCVPRFWPRGVTDLVIWRSGGLTLSV